MTVTLGVIEVGAALVTLLAGLFYHAQAISRWRAQIESQVAFLIDEDKRIHDRIEGHNEKVLNKLDGIASDLKKLELRAAHEDGQKEAAKAIQEGTR